MQITDWILQKIARTSSSSFLVFCGILDKNIDVQIWECWSEPPLKKRILTSDIVWDFVWNIFDNFPHFELMNNHWFVYPNISVSYYCICPILKRNQIFLCSFLNTIIHSLPFGWSPRSRTISWWRFCSDCL